MLFLAEETWPFLWPHSYLAWATVGCLMSPGCVHSAWGFTAPHVLGALHLAQESLRQSTSRVSPSASWLPFFPLNVQLINVKVHSLIVLRNHCSPCGWIASSTPAYQRSYFNSLVEECLAGASSVRSRAVLKNGRSQDSRWALETTREPLS